VFVSLFASAANKSFPRWPRGLVCFAALAMTT
jgi:hypothetical protein